MEVGAGLSPPFIPAELLDSGHANRRAHTFLTFSFPSPPFDLDHLSDSLPSQASLTPVDTQQPDTKWSPVAILKRSMPPAGSDIPSRQRVRCRRRGVRLIIGGVNIAIRENRCGVGTVALSSSIGSVISPSAANPSNPRGQWSSEANGNALSNRSPV